MTTLHILFKMRLSLESAFPFLVRISVDRFDETNYMRRSPQNWVQSFRALPLGGEAGIHDARPGFRARGAGSRARNTAAFRRIMIIRSKLNP